MKQPQPVVLLNAADINKRWNGKIREDAIRDLMKSGAIKSAMIGKQWVAHLRYVEAFELAMFEGSDPLQFNAGLPTEILIAPGNFILNGKSKKQSTKVQPLQGAGYA